MSDPNYQIRAYSEDDKNYVTELMEQLCTVYNVEFNKERWKKSLEEKIQISDFTQLLVAEMEGKIVGMLVADIRRGGNGRAGYLTNLIVAPDFRNLGVGESLINEAMEFFKSNHVTTVKVNVRIKNESAMKLFAKLGFKEHIIQLERTI
ncbi:MAG: GNAT family N-acetyltransferase [Candidatus Hodarchaeota archaeon]